MQAGSAVRRSGGVAPWLLTVLGLGLLALLFLSFALDEPPAPSVPGPRPSEARVAYFEFVTTSDTLWLAEVAEPSRREGLLSVRHAPEYGVLASLSPAGDRVAYTALPPDTAAPGRDSPADLWVVDLREGAEPRRLAGGVDLLVRPVWSPDGELIAVRRSGGAGGYRLAAVSLTDGRERAVLDSPEAAFPVAFTKDGRTLAYVALNAAGSYLRSVEVDGGGQSDLARLSDGLTRDWALSPDGRSLAYVALSYRGGEASSRAFVLDFATLAVRPVGDPSADAFGPVWSPQGRLVIGSLGSGGVALLTADGRALPGPARGFEVPLAAGAGDSGYVVRSFTGSSVSAPGAASLTYIAPDGARKTIASGEVTFVGWIEP